MKGKRYRKYLASPEWSARRQQAIARAGGRCQLCNSGGPFQVHHRTYERVGRERPEDLTVLCAGCHHRYHRTTRPGPPKRGERRREIEGEIQAILQHGPMPWKLVKTQIQASPNQSWARARRMLKRGEIRWTEDGKRLVRS